MLNTVLYSIGIVWWKSESDKIQDWLSDPDYEAETDPYTNDTLIGWCK
jgi:hypothetical protein